MRDIKFRAWDGDHKCWRFGWLTKLVEGARCFFAIICHNSEADLVRYYIHDSETIGQFTGLLDKNGKEIYEGDVMQVTANPNHGKGTIRFGAYRLENFTKHDRQRNHYGFYILFNGKGISLIHSMVTPEGYGSSTHSVEVVGNIHENPELLEGLS